MAYGVAPKVQGTGMAPRQQAMQRRTGFQQTETNGVIAPPKGPNFNTAYGIQQGQHLNNGGPKYNGKDNGKPGWAANGTKVNNPVLGPVKTNVVGGGGPVGGPVVGGPANPLGTGDPELDKYLAGDDTYQSILASLQRNKDMNKTNYDYNTANLNTDNETIRRRLAKQEVDDNKLLDNDYAARGLFGSGLFAKADADLGQNYSNQNTDLATSLSRNLQQLLTDYTSQQGLDEETQRQAQLDAITRRAQEFGIMGGPSNLTEKPGKDGKDGKDGKNGKDKGKDKGKKGKK